MYERIVSEGVSRRNVVRGLAGTGAALMGGSVIGSVSANNGSLVGRINSTGGYAVFGADPLVWRQSSNPLDVTEGSAHWIAEPASGGALRCVVEGDVAPGNVGGYIDAGRLGDIDEITIESTAVSEGALLWLGLFFDTDDTGAFWEWERYHGNTEQFVSLGDDPECLDAFPAGGETVLEEDTAFGTLIIPDYAVPEGHEDDFDIVEPLGFAVAEEITDVTWADFAVGEYDTGDYVVDLLTDEDTRVGLGLAVFAADDGEHEVRIEDVTIS